jgi:magnesium chelatase subunit H
VAILLALVGAKPVKEGTGRVVRYDLIPLEELKRPRVDVLASLSGIFRDSFANIVDLLDDMFERAAQADEPSDMNFIKKHAQELIASGVDERPAARLFSNPYVYRKESSRCCCLNMDRPHHCLFACFCYSQSWRLR